MQFGCYVHALRFYEGLSFYKAVYLTKYLQCYLFYIKLNTTFAV